MMIRRCKGYTLFFLLLLAGLVFGPVECRAALSQSKTRADADKVVDMVCGNWQNDYFEKAIVTPGSRVVRVDGVSRAFASFFGVSRTETDQAVRSTAAIQSYFRRKGGLYETKAQQDGTVVVTAPYQMMRLVVLKKIRETYGAKEMIHTYNDHDTILQFDSQEKTREAFRKIRKRYGEKSCYRDRYVQLFDTDSSQASLMSNKTYSWGVRYMQMNTLKQQAAKRKDLSTVKVAMIDSGINRDSFFFRGKKILSSSRSFSSSPSDISDMVGHGTHVAGVIAEATPSNVQLMMLKVTNSSGKASFLTIREAFWYAISNGADIINFSMGTVDFSDMDILDSAISNAYNRGIPTCVAAGNNGINAKYCYPANYSKAITVSSVTESGELANYSNYGNLIDFGAPGDRIIGASKWSDSGCVMYSGTSMAVPHISAACAYIKMLRPSASVDLTVRELKRLSVDLGASGKDKKFGYGCPRLGSLFKTNVVSKEIVYTSKPKITSSVNTKNAILLTWTQVRNSKKYIIYRKKKGGKYKIVKQLSAGSSMWYDKSAKPGVKYFYRIRAKFKKKYTSYGNKVSLIRLRIPGSFRTYSQKGRITMVWNKAKGAEIYRIQLSKYADFRKVSTYKVSGKKTRYRINGLGTGTYYVRIRSVKDGSGSMWCSGRKVKVP